MTMAALIPAVLALVHVGRRIVGRLMLLGALTGIYAALAASFLPWVSHFPSPLDVLLPTSTLVVAYAIFSVFLWNTSGQLTETATELSAAIEPSREVGQTLDPRAAGRAPGAGGAAGVAQTLGPQLGGNTTARHIALAADAADCTLSTWDRAGD